jgi:hypothetical protein
VNGGGAPKPPPELWAELEAAGRAAAGTGYETDPRWLIARARYKTWLHEQDIEGTPRPPPRPCPDRRRRRGVDLMARPTIAALQTEIRSGSAPRSPSPSNSTSPAPRPTSSGSSAASAATRTPATPPSR